MTVRRIPLLRHAPTMKAAWMETTMKRTFDSARRRPGAESTSGTMQRTVEGRHFKPHQRKKKGTLYDPFLWIWMQCGIGTSRMRSAQAARLFFISSKKNAM